MAKDDKIILACTVCLSRNYATHRSKSKANKRLELMKYCPRCGRKTLHKETK
ncbi:MAG: 50S ribosomal protein L33 [Solobacterium sp.]|jgi:large subunit ribosomal protein L33|nr:50S ribosomal protein L33 [Solobacterium sp.]